MKLLCSDEQPLSRATNKGYVQYYSGCSIKRLINNFLIFYIMDFEFKKDKYKTARGTHSRLLNLFCRVCGEKILVYQKDGPGNLRRLYFDRILFPKNLTSNN